MRVWLPLLVVFLGSFELFATERCAVIIALRNPSDAVRPENVRFTVEANIDANFLWPHLDTRSHTIADVLTSWELNHETRRIEPVLLPVPVWLKEWWLARENSQPVRVQGGTYYGMYWRDLPRPIQNRLLAYAARYYIAPEQSPYAAPKREDAERAWHPGRDGGTSGLQLSGLIDLPVEKPTRLFGRVLSPGRSTVLLDEFQPFSVYARLTQGMYNVVEPLTTLTGDRLEAGPNYVMVAAIQQGAGIEHSGPHDLARLACDEQPGMFQIHLRSPKGKASASEMINSTWHFTDRLGVERPSLHLHAVADMPPGLRGSSFARLADGFSVLNLWLESNDLEEYRTLMEGFPLLEKREAENHRSFYEYLNSAKVAQAAWKNIDYATDDRPTWVGDAFKGGAIGMHWSLDIQQTYDETEVIGFQFRGIDANSPSQSTFALVDSVSSQLSLQDYRRPLHVFEAWADYRAGYEGEISQEDLNVFAVKFARTRWHQPWDELFSYAAPEVAAEITPELKKWMKETTEFKPAPAGFEEISKHLELKMLIHDSANLFEFRNRPAAVAKVRAAQVKALKKLKEFYLAPHTEGDIISLMQSYLIESGLWEMRSRQFKLKYQLTTPPAPL